MEYLRIDGEFPRLAKSAVTLGKFDGIHRGHQKLVNKVLEQKEKGAQAVLFAFDVSSRTILTREERSGRSSGLSVRQPDEAYEG
jgi:riboflavin kinase/FMN adenylyltransferase